MNKFQNIWKLMTLLFLFGWIFVISNCNTAEKGTKTPPASQATTGERIGDYIVAMFEDSNGNLWFGTLAKGIAKFDGNTLKYLTSDDGFPSNCVKAVLEDEQGILWFGTSSGLVKYDGNSVVVYDESDGLCNNNIASLFMDSKGVFWIATWGGVCIFDGTSFTKFELPNPTIDHPLNPDTENWITEIQEDQNGNMWFARDGLGISVYDGKGFRHITKENGISSNFVHDFHLEENGDVWVTSRFANEIREPGDTLPPDGGLDLLSENGIRDFPDEAGLYRNTVNSVFEDDNGDLWFSSTDQGVYRYTGNDFINYPVLNPSSGSTVPVQGFFRDSRGRMWLGCSGGLYLLKEGKGVEVTMKGILDLS